MIAWPLFLAECIITAGAIVLAILNYNRKTGGYKQVVIILPWLFIKLAWALHLLARVVMLGGSFTMTEADSTITFLLLVAGPTSIMALLGARLWTRG